MSHSMDRVENSLVVTEVENEVHKATMDTEAELYEFLRPSNSSTCVELERIQTNGITDSALNIENNNCGEQILTQEDASVAENRDNASESVLPLEDEASTQHGLDIKNDENSVSAETSDIDVHGAVQVAMSAHTRQGDLVLHTEVVVNSGNVEEVSESNLVETSSHPDLNNDENVADVNNSRSEIPENNRQFIVSCENGAVTSLDPTDSHHDPSAHDDQIVEEINIKDESEIKHDSDTDNTMTQIEGQIEKLNDVLGANDVTESVGNDSDYVKETCFNKEQLLDILEGNDNSSEIKVNTALPFNQNEEVNKALEQLIKMPKKPIYRKHHKYINENANNISKSKLKTSNKHEENTVKKIVDEWADDDGVEVSENSETSIQVHHVTESNILALPDSARDNKQDEKSKMKRNNKPKKSRKTNKFVVKTDKKHIKKDNITISPNLENETANTTASENEDLQPKRRMSRVIKKKVIFDPDNPDTFTSSKAGTSEKRKSLDKIESPPKKVKSEKSPKKIKTESSDIDGPTVSPSWKKPAPKNTKQHKRLSEVDRLLMDEGAVNMIYQLKTSEQDLKKTKNMKSKAEYIKKINETAPIDDEMKFRERRKESKGDDSDVKSVGSYKQKSLKSPSQDDYEVHSADDSIIYRRHSSSSYSSACMSPRRLSDVDTVSKPLKTETNSDISKDHSDKFSDIFMADVSMDITGSLLDKRDCLSLKEKLKSKLSSALGQKHRKDVGRPNKITKLKKTEGTKEKPILCQLSLAIDNHIAEIKILNTTSEHNMFNTMTFIEIEKALEYVDQRSDVNVTLLVSNSGHLCPGLDLRSLLSGSAVEKKIAAFDLADAAQRALRSVWRHSKIVVSGCEGACEGWGVAAAALCDVCVASDRASFSLLGARRAELLAPGLALFASHRLPLPLPLMKEMVLFARRLSGAEALQRGLITRTLWPDRFEHELRSMAADIAAQPPAAIKIKKKLLRLQETEESKKTFLSCLEEERDLLVEYWTSTEGQAAIKSYAEDN